MAAAETITANPNAISKLDGMPAAEIIPSYRDETGKFLPGNCANPDGRPKSRLFSEELRSLLERADAVDRTGAERLGARIMKMAEQEKDEWLALAAIKEIVDRTEGKAVQNMNVKGLMVMVPADETIAAGFAGQEPE